MSLSLLLIIFIILSFSIMLISITIHFRNKIEKMTGMMVAMSIGVSVGLTIGVIFGILIPDNFYLATLYGMIIGMVAGFIAGIPISILAVMDGALSGLMGGMMGAMLGDMIDSQYYDSIVKIMFFLFVSVSFILLYMIQNEVKKDALPFYTKLPFIIFFYAFLFIVLQQIGPTFTDTDAPTNHYHSLSDNDTLELKR